MAKLFDLVSNKKILLMLLLFVSIPLILFPRFDMQDIPLIRPFVGLHNGELSPDQRNYINFVEYFRNNMPLDSCHAPYSFRPAVPFTASLLDFKPMTSINIINSISIILSVIFIWLTLKALNFSYEMKILGSLLFVVSFPTFYYSTTGYVDATATMLIFAAVYFRIKQQDLILIPVMIISALTKETSIIVFPFLFIHLFFDSENSNAKFNCKAIFKSLLIPSDKFKRRSYLLIWLAFISFIAALILSRKFFGGYGSGSGYLWLPSYEHMMDNVFRVKTYLSLVLALGIPGLFAFLSMIYLKKIRLDSIYLSFIIGMLTSLLLWVYSYFSAYSDGRFIWTAYPFMIPLGLKFISNFKSTFKQNQSGFDISS